MSVHPVEDVDAYDSLTRVSTAGAYHGDCQGNEVCCLYEALDGLGNQKGKGGVVVIRANSLTIVRIYPDPSPQNIRPPNRVTLISSHRSRNLLRNCAQLPVQTG